LLKEFEALIEAGDLKPWQFAGGLTSDLVLAAPL
jgi:hypothetical protein